MLRRHESATNAKLSEISRRAKRPLVAEGQADMSVKAGEGARFLRLDPHSLSNLQETKPMLVVRIYR